VLVREDGEVLRVIPVLCDTWGCKLCGPRKAAWLIRELAAAQARHGLGFFWTLTVRVGSCSAEESSRLITRWWDNLSRRLRRQFGKFSFIWIMEHTEAGYAHLHLLVSLDLAAIAPVEASARRADIAAWLDRRKAAELGSSPVAWSLAFVSNEWREVTGGSYVVDVAPVESERASKYITKYCSQQARQRAQAGYEHLQGRRFYSTSRDIQFAPFRTAGATTERLDTDTGAIEEVSEWRRIEVPYWEFVEAKKRSMTPAVQRVAGVPFVEFRRREVEQAETEQATDGEGAVGDGCGAGGGCGRDGERGRAGAGVSVLWGADGIRGAAGDGGVPGE
jgi:hypothetical protein